MANLPHEILPEKVAEFRRRLWPVVSDVGTVLKEELTKRASLDDHTLKELERLGYPYRQQQGETYARTTKTGKWQAGIRKAARQIREGTLGHDIKLVHAQSKRLLEAIYQRMVETDDSIRVVVGVDVSIFPEIRYVVLGTRKMIPRDIIGMSAVAAKPRMYKILRNAINDAFRSGLTR